MKVRGRLPGTHTVMDAHVEGDTIVALEPAAGVAELGADDAVLAPAFCDLQVNGYAGRDFNSGFWSKQPARPETAAEIVAALAPTGTGLLCPTLVTNAPAAIIEGMQALAAACEQDEAVAAAVLGVHLEGPFVCSEEGPRGAHPPEHIRDPDWDLFQQFQEASGGRIRILTVAPERPGAAEFIAQVVASGVVVSLGHHHGTHDTIQAAVDAGATLCTHLGNGSHAMLPRHDNYLWEQLAEDRLTAMIISDGHHLPPPVLRCFARIKSARRLIVVSDVVALGGLPAGLYDDGRHEVLPSGRVNLAGTPYLAGAGHCLDTCLAHLRRRTELDEADVVATVTAQPAAALGLGAEHGLLATGRRADLTSFRWPDDDGPVEVLATVVAGQVRYRASVAGRSSPSAG